MKTKNSDINNVEEYIASFPYEVQLKLIELRSIIKKLAPKSEEGISYKMPAYKYYGALVYFAAYKNHIGFYPTAQPIKYFADELKIFENSKGAVQFPLDKPLPLSLIKRMVKYKMNYNLSRNNVI
jgi:uncharacterized protein YdhG (YjbR/CyaY superfamily)